MKKNKYNPIPTHNLRWWKIRFKDYGNIPFGTNVFIQVYISRSILIHRLYTFTINLDHIVYVNTNSPWPLNFTLTNIFDIFIFQPTSEKNTPWDIPEHDFITFRFTCEGCTFLTFSYGKCRKLWRIEFLVTKGDQKWEFILIL